MAIRKTTPPVTGMATGAKVTRIKGSLVRTPGANYQGVTAPKLQASASIAAKAGAKRGGAGGYGGAGMGSQLGGAYKPMTTGPKGKVSYGNSSIVKKKK